MDYLLKKINVLTYLLKKNFKQVKLLRKEELNLFNVICYINDDVLKTEIIVCIIA